MWVFKIFAAKYAHMYDLWIKGKTIANCRLCPVSHLHHINEDPSAFKATNRWSALIASTHNNAWYVSSTNFVELEVNIPRTIGILRDLAPSLKSTKLGRLTVEIFQFLRLSSKFLAVLRLSVNPIETLMAATARVIWLSACVRYWPDRG